MYLFQDQYFFDDECVPDEIQDETNKLPLSSKSETGSKNLLVSDKGNVKINDRRKFQYSRFAKTRKYGSAHAQCEDFACLEELFNVPKSVDEAEMSEDPQVELRIHKSSRLLASPQANLQGKDIFKYPSKGSRKTAGSSPDVKAYAKFDDVTFCKPDLFEAELPSEVNHYKDFSLMN